MSKAVAQTAKRVTSLLDQFFDKEVNFGVRELRLKERPGRSWTADELRLKENVDLHKLWYVLLKERNMLLTMEHAYNIRNKIFPNPERLDRVKESMDNLEYVVHERNDAFLKLETGDSASPPMRSVTSFMGFTYKEPAKEHYAPFEETKKKEYETPYLDDDAYLMQRLWKEKQHMKEEIAEHDKYLELEQDTDINFRLMGGLRKSFNRVDHLPKNVVASKRGPQSSTT